MRSARQRHAGASAAPAGCCGPDRRPHTAPGDGGARSAPETPPGAWQGEQGHAACLQLTMRQGERFSLTSRSSARRSISSQGSRAAATSCLFASLGHGEKAGSHPRHCRGPHVLAPPGTASPRQPCCTARNPIHGLPLLAPTPNPAGHSRETQPYSKRGFPETSG